MSMLGQQNYSARAPRLRPWQQWPRHPPCPPPTEQYGQCRQSSTATSIMVDLPQRDGLYRFAIVLKQRDTVRQRSASAQVQATGRGGAARTRGGPGRHVDHKPPDSRHDLRLLVQSSATPASTPDMVTIRTPTSDHNSASGHLPSVH